MESARILSSNNIYTKKTATQTVTGDEALILTPPDLRARADCSQSCHTADSRWRTGEGLPREEGATECDLDMPAHPAYLIWGV